MYHLKNVRVRNPKNILVQIPGFISAEKWQVKTDDVLEVFLSDTGEEIIIRRREVQAGSHDNKEGKGLFRNAT